MNPTISIIIPLYNKNQEIKRAIDSVLSQTYSDFELIIVDGGSTDGSVETVNSYIDKRINLIHQVSKGAALARNEGILYSNSELIAFLDADDTWNPNFLQVVMDMYSRYPNAGAYGTSGHIKINDSYQVANHRGIPTGQWNGYLKSYYLSMALGDPILSVSAVMIPRKVFENVGLFKPCLWFEDVELFGRIAYYYPIAYSTETCSTYYLSASNKVTDKKPTSLESHPLIDYFTETPKSQLYNPQLSSDIELYIQKLYLTLAGMHLLSEDGKRVRENLAHISDNIYLRQKHQYLLLSYLPNCILRFIRRHNAQIMFLRIALSKRLSNKNKYDECI